MSNTEASKPLSSPMKTDILQVDPTRIGKITTRFNTDSLLDDWYIKWSADTQDFANLQLAASQLRTTNVPVAFPTETVYGLGADATNSAAVRGIFLAKQRPMDNPLIVHFYSLEQLRTLLQPTDGNDPIPAIYKPLIQRFWPGPLTIILPSRAGSVLAPEVTAGLQTFGARIPRSLLALCLIKLAGIPLAAPSANASTRPSPTAAEHVKDDLDGRIETIIDGGPCEVGVESTVVDGLSSPPSILRPGGISLEQIRQCPGWENVVVGYKDKHEQGIQPKAPGMKYRHYSPKATVVLYEAGTGKPDLPVILSYVKNTSRIGIIRTKLWSTACGLPVITSNGTEANGLHVVEPAVPEQVIPSTSDRVGDGAVSQSGFIDLLQSLAPISIPRAHKMSLLLDSSRTMEIWDIDLGAVAAGVARGLFSALRELDKHDVDTIFVEGVADIEGDIATAVMNRLRKAAEVRI